MQLKKNYKKKEEDSLYLKMGEHMPLKEIIFCICEL